MLELVHTYVNKCGVHRRRREGGGRAKGFSLGEKTSLSMFVNVYEIEKKNEKTLLGHFHNGLYLSVHMCGHQFSIAMSHEHSLRYSAVLILNPFLSF